MKIENASAFPKVYYGLHFCEGVAQYKEEGQDAYRIFIGENTMKKMDPTFVGKPVFVRHVDSVDLPNLQNEADGYVIESFYNPSDGKHWAKFIVVSDQGNESILQKKWKLSNSYRPKTFAPGGQWHGVDFVNEVTSAEYDHLAIVPDPRYSESIILTPEEFKRYNSEKELELKQLSNSKTENKGEKSMLNFFKKTKVDNGSDYENTSVLLPKSKVEVTLSQLVNELDEYRLKMDLPQMANGDHMVEMGQDKMSVNDLLEKHKMMCQELADLKKPKEEAPEEKKENDDDMAEASADNKKNDQKDEEQDLEVEKKQKAAQEKKENEMKVFNELKNAPINFKDEERRIELSQDKITRGKTRYGSGN